MLQVPARTAEPERRRGSATRWYASVGASRAFDWINYDELRSRADVRGRHASGASISPARSFGSSGGTTTARSRLRAAASRDFRDLFTFEISGDNLLSHQLNEPDNMTVLPGRTIMTGVRLKF